MKVERRKTSASEAVPASEFLDAAQALLGLANRTERPVLVQVTGPRGGEGATTVAVSLAGILHAQTASSVLLLSGDAEGDDVAAPTVSPSSSLRADMAEWHPGASLILIDGPPLLTSVVASDIARQVDAVLLVLEAERTPISDAVAAKLSVERAGGSVLGTVLNKRRYTLPVPLAGLLGLPSSRNAPKLMPLVAGMAAMGLLMIGYVLFLIRDPEVVAPDPEQPRGPVASGATQ